jgi:hypothetical protein
VQALRPSRNEVEQSQQDGCAQQVIEGGVVVRPAGDPGIAQALEGVVLGRDVVSGLEQVSEEEVGSRPEMLDDEQVPDPGRRSMPGRRGHVMWAIFARIRIASSR